MGNPSFVSTLILSGFLCGCNALYSPSLHLPERPLAKNDGLVTIGYGTLNDVTGYDDVLSFSDGNDILVRYGFSDRLSLGVKWWSSTSVFGRGFYNGGFLANGVYTLNDRDKDLVFGIIPTWSMLFTNDEVIAMGGSLQTAAWLPRIAIVRPYIASGPGVIVQNFRNDEWGYGLITNVGLTYDITKDFHVNGELSTVWGYRVSSKDIFTTIAPSISVSWNFHNQ